jgi:hypothetical protein
MTERFQWRMAATSLLVAALGMAGRAVHAQSTRPDLTPQRGSPATATPSRLPLPFRGGPLITAYAVWGGSAVSVRTAANNEPFDGAAFSMIGVQASRSLFTRKRFRFSWLVEVLPAIVATVSAPDNRRPSPTRNADAFNDPTRRALYLVRDVYGAGISPFGAEVSRSLAGPLSASFSVTAGGAIFSGVVPYGKATHANFTVAPALAIAWTLTDRYAISSGYALHHLSNASFGGSNPGLNSHLLYFKFAAARLGARAR